MKLYLRLLAYLKPYWKQMTTALVFMLFYLLVLTALWLNAYLRLWGG